MKYQNYLHYKLPITTNPLEYGKLIEQFNNKYFIQLNTLNVITLKQIEDTNYIKFYRKGDLLFEIIDSKISENSFTRTILDTKFTFSDDKIISTEIMNN